MSSDELINSALNAAANEVEENLNDSTNSSSSSVDKQTLQAMSEQLQQSLVCGICLDKMYQPCTILCQHTFCHECLVKHKERSCPICKLKFVLPVEYNRIIDTASSVFFHNEWIERDEQYQHAVMRRDLKTKVETQIRREIFEQVVNGNSSVNIDPDADANDDSDSDEFNAGGLNEAADELFGHREHTRVLDGIIKNLQDTIGLKTIEDIFKTATILHVVFKTLIAIGCLMILTPVLSYIPYVSHLCLFVEAILGTIFTATFVVALIGLNLMMAKVSTRLRSHAARSAVQ